MAELVTFTLFAGVAAVVFSALSAGIKVGGAGFAVQRIYVSDDVWNWVCAGRSRAMVGSPHVPQGSLRIRGWIAACAAACRITVPQTAAFQCTAVNKGAHTGAESVGGADSNALIARSCSPSKVP